MRVATFVVPLVSLLVGAPGAKSATAAPTAPAATRWTLSDEETLEAPGLSVRLFHDSYPEGKQGGLTLIQHGERVAAVGDVRLAPAPEQWAPLPKPGRRIVDKKTLRLEMPLAYEGEGPAYRIAVEPCGAALCVSVDVERPLAQALVGRAGFNLELFPAALFGKSYHLGARSAVFPRQANGPRERDAAGVLQLAALAQGRRLDVAPEDPLRHLTIEALAGGDLLAATVRRTAGLWCAR
jgi:endoglucanase